MTDAESLLGLDALLTPMQREVRDRARTAGAIIASTIDADAEACLFRREYVEVLADAGLVGLGIAGPGADADPIAYGLACYELEAVDTSWRTFLSVQGPLAMGAIARYGSPEQRERWLEPMAAGRAIGCFALTEPSGGSDPASMATTAVPDGDGWRITGAKRWIGLGSIADVAIVWARTEEGVRGFLVETPAEGFIATDIVDKFALRASIQSEIILDGVRAQPLPGAVGLGAPFRCLTDARYGIAWGVLGAARACLDAAVTRSATREVFGGPIGGKQLVQARLAEAFVDYEKGMLLALHLGALKARGELTPAQMSVGKLSNVRTAIAVAHAAREILAGDGITAQFPVMRHLANLEAVRTYEGTDDIHTLVIGRALTGLAAF
jgi:glutaryl-CoA dehydrogenase